MHFSSGACPMGAHLGREVCAVPYHGDIMAWCRISNLNPTLEIAVRFSRAQHEGQLLCIFGKLGSKRDDGDGTRKI
jgi:hypothetical protein